MTARTDARTASANQPGMPAGEKEQDRHVGIG